MLNNDTRLVIDHLINTDSSTFVLRRVALMDHHEIAYISQKLSEKIESSDLCPTWCLPLKEICDRLVQYQNE